MKRIKSFFSLFGLILFATISMGQDASVIKGVTRSKEGPLIRGVSVSLLGTDKGTTTDKNGYFEFNGVLPGNRTIEFSYLGYLSKQTTITISPNEVYQIDVVLEKDYFLLGEVKVTSSINKPGEVTRLADVHNTYIVSGKKNEVVQVDGMNANLSEKTGRQIFAKIPGTFVYDMDGSGNQVNIATRGLDPHRSWEYNVRQNGIITNSDLYGYPASHYSAPMESIRKVELVRGTSSLQYGAEFGGMINYITKGPDTTRAIGFENISSLGSYGLLSTYNAIGGKVGKLSYYGYISSRKSDGYRNNARSDYNAQYIGLSYSFTPDVSLKAELGHMRYIYQIPGPLTDSMFKINHLQSTRQRNYFNPDIYVPSLTFDWEINETTQLNIIASAILGKRNSVQFVGFATTLDTIHRSTGQYSPRQVDIDGFNSYTSEIRLLHKYRIMRLTNTVSTGLRVIHNNLHRRQLGTGTTGTDFDLALSVPGFGRNLQFKTKNIAVFIENMVSVTERFSITPGFRYENGVSVMEGTISYYDPGNLPNKIYHQFPLFGITSQYNFNNGSCLYAGWAQAYRPVLFSDIIPPATLDRTDKDLKDAKGYNLEVGASGKIGRAITYDVGLFAMQYNNRIGSLIDTDAAGESYVFKTNVGSSSTKGVELFMEINPSMFFGIQGDVRWSVFTSTSYMDAHYTKGNVVSAGANKSITGNRLETVPRWISRNGLNIGYKAFNTTFQLSHVSESYSDALNTVVPNASGSAGIVPAYTIFDINGSYRFSENIVFKLGLNNVFDKQYFTKRPAGYPGPGVWASDGRGLVATVHVKL